MSRTRIPTGSDPLSFLIVVPSFHPELPMDARSSISVSIAGLLAEQTVAVLATIRNGAPHASLVVFTAADDLRAIYFAAGRDTRKFADIAAEPRVSLLIDNRTDFPAALSGAAALTITGRAAEADTETGDRIRALLMGRDPRLADFLADPGAAIIRVTAERYILVQGIDRVREWIPG